MVWRIIALLSFIFIVSFKALSLEIPTSDRAEKAIAQVEPILKKQLAEKGLIYGSPIFMRIFKEPGVLELWLETDNGTFKHFKDYEICTFSGSLGPKLKEGDYQSPEGFYYVTPNRLNPWSRFHLSFNLGYPNSYDRYHGRTGSALMVHGNCVSVGCFAMTDAHINEIYALSVAAFKSGQPFFRVHSFPFKLDTESLNKQKGHTWFSFWQNLKEGYDLFEQNKVPPNVEAINGKYVFN